MMVKVAGGGGGAGHGFYSPLTIDRTQAGASDSTNFPILVSLTDVRFKDVAHSGHVNRSDGFDLGFFSDTGITTRLKHELELYVPTTGQIIAWVKIPTVNHSGSDSVFYAACGDTSITTDQSDLPNTWSNGFARVVHGGDGSSLSGVDSVGGNNFTATNVTASTGQIYGGANFATSASNIWTNNAAAFTARPAWFSAWFKMSSTTFGAGEDRIIASVAKTSGLDEFWLSAFENGGTKYLRIVEQNAGTNFDLRGAITPDLNWHHMVGGMTTVNTGNIFLDGSALSLSTVGTQNTPAGLTDSYIGALMYNTSNFYGPWKGDLDEVRFHTVARTVDWALLEYNNQKTGSTLLTLGTELTF